MRPFLAAVILSGPPAWAGGVEDSDSFATVDQFRVTHIALDLSVDFPSRVLRGSGGLEIKRLDPRAEQLVLDTRGLIIGEVSQLSTDIVGQTSKSEPIWVSRPFSLGKADPILGSPLIIELPPSRAATVTLKIDYETTPGAAALQWVTPAQNAGRKQPFMFTQSEPINARSWIPLQDTPLVRVTYRAVIHTPDGVVAVMSAPNNPNAKRSGDYFFEMTRAIPSYLIALAVGDLKFKSTGPRTGVYAERSGVAAAAAEFSDTEAMIVAAEKIAGPYRWVRQDILVLPPSFPLGGMENPGLSFVTPTAVAGDKSQVSLIAHELSHSWPGNLVGNATWRDLWLNEGFSAYLESRIMQAVYGERRATLEDVLDLAALRAEMAVLAPTDQALVTDPAGRDPADAFNGITCEKGRLFFDYLDAKFGRERFDAFIHGYFEHFAFQGITTEQFLAYLRDNLLDRNPGAASYAQIDAWVGGPGLPPDAVLPAATAFDRIDSARAEWLAGKVPPAKLDTRDWAPEEWLYFLDGMPALGAAQLAGLDAAFGFSHSRNAQIEHSWFMQTIRDDYRPAYAPLQIYLKSTGRRKLILPLYQALMRTQSGAEFARRVYSQARPGYHPVTASSIDAIVIIKQ